MSVSLPQRVLK